MVGFSSGKEKVNTRMERYEIRAASKGFVKQVVIEVEDAAVYFESVAVHLGDGEVVDLPIRSIIEAGERTRVMDFPGNACLIRKVVIRASKTPVFQESGSHTVRSEITHFAG